MIYTDILDTTTLEGCFANGTITHQDAKACNNRKTQDTLADKAINAGPDSHIGYTCGICHFVGMGDFEMSDIFLVETADGSVYGIVLDDRDMLDLLFRWLFFPNA
jgi:hypothetical protein